MFYERRRGSAALRTSDGDGFQARVNSECPQEMADVVLDSGTLLSP